MMKAMQNITIKTLWSACLALGCFFASSTSGAEVFSSVATPIEATAPLTPTMPDPEPEEVLEPKPEPREPIAQRIHILEDSSFVVLPEDAPVPYGSLSKDMLTGGSAVVEAPQGATPTVQASQAPPIIKPAAPKLERGRLTGKLIQATNGQQYLRLEGKSAGGFLKVYTLQGAPKVAFVDAGAPQIMVEAAKAEVMPKSEPKPVAAQEVKKPVVQPKPKPKVEKLALQMEYFVDQVKPLDDETVEAFVAKLKDKQIKHMNIVAQSASVPFQEADVLPGERWRYLARVLSDNGIDLKGVETSEILLTQEDAQFLEVEFRLAP